MEDSKVIREMYRNKLIMEEFTVVTADNGMEAVKVLSQEKPDLILLDLMMPVMDGYKVLQVVKTDPKLSGIPVLVFSAKGQPEEVERALNLGAAGYFVKATSKPEKVVEKIRLILSQKLKSQEVAHYSLEIRNDAYDAVKLASDFSLNGLECPKCQQPMLLSLVPDFSQEATWFCGKFYCPKCEG